MIARVAAVGAIALVAVLAVYLLLIRGSGGHEYTFVFQTAGQLVKGDNVQVGGRPVGTVKSIELRNDNQAAIGVKVKEPYAPLREGTQAVVRLTSLSGIANRYIALVPAPDNAPKLADGATITQTTTPVDLDQIFNAIDERTRGDLQGVIKGFATQYRGRAAEAGESTKYLNPLLSTSRRLVEEATRDEGALTRFLVNSAGAMTTIASKRDDLSALVGNANATTRAIADENDALSQALSLLPTTLRRGNTTFVNLRATLDDLDVLVDESKPATKRLAPMLRELRPLVHDTRPTVADLRTLLNRPGSGNDLVDATRKLPGLERVASPALLHGTQALQKLQPVLEFARPYMPELTGWFRDFGVGAANYDANGHFARIQPIFNAFQLDEQSQTLVPIPPSSRFNGLQANNFTRCPGSASQPVPDGSAPYRDSGGNLDCDPRQTPPGP